VGTPSNFGQSCGSCGGRIGCDGACTVGTPSNFGQSCGSCGGKIGCDEKCSVETPSNFGQSCGSCGGKIGCDGKCSVTTPSDYGKPCGCGGTVVCDGVCTHDFDVRMGVPGTGCGSRWFGGDDREGIMMGRSVADGQSFRVKTNMRLKQFSLYITRGFRSSGATASGPVSQDIVLIIRSQKSGILAKVQGKLDGQAAPGMFTWAVDVSLVTGDVYFAYAYAKGLIGIPGPNTGVSMCSGNPYPDGQMIGIDLTAPSTDADFDNWVPIEYSEPVVEEDAGFEAAGCSQ
jgi:hypothetical protein